ESLTISIDYNDLDSCRLIASLQETQLEIRDRGAEKWWAKKWKTWGLMALFFCPPFFCHCKGTTDISIDVNMPFNVNAFQGDQSVVDVLDSGCQNAQDHGDRGVDSDSRSDCTEV